MHSYVVWCPKWTKNIGWYVSTEDERPFWEKQTKVQGKILTLGSDIQGYCYKIYKTKMKPGFVLENTKTKFIQFQKDINFRSQKNTKPNYSIYNSAGCKLLSSWEYLWDIHKLRWQVRWYIQEISPGMQ